jgi:hypothetical protein
MYTAAPAAAPRNTAPSRSSCTASPAQALALLMPAALVAAAPAAAGSTLSSGRMN